MSGLAFPKPEPRVKQRTRRRLDERDVISVVRAAVSGRDGRCRLYGLEKWFGSCRGPAQWAHLDKRSATMGRPPEERHRTDNTLMLCDSHHGMLDGEIGGKRLVIERLTPAGADGLLRFTHLLLRHVYEESA